MFHWPLLLLLGSLLFAPAQVGATGTVLMLDIDGSIGTITSDYVNRGLEKAAETPDGILLLRMDTPGGLDSAMREIVKGILASPVPVVTYVSPSGARAASAGTYILYASHVAAMAPATNLGSATPVSIGGLPGLPSPDEQTTPGMSAPESNEGPTQSGQPQPDNNKGKAATGGSAMERKIVHDAAAFLRGLAELRGRNAKWAEETVRLGVSITSSEALQHQVIDLIANDLDQLLHELDGREITIAGEAVTLHTADATIEHLDMDWRSRLLATITDPTIAYMLMLIGIYGLIFELANPGSILPGVLGSIALVLALYAFQTLPVNYAGLALLGLGVTFMVAETFAPSFGALGIGGVVAFVTGSLILYDDQAGNLAVALPVIITFAVLSVALFVGVIGYAVKTRHKPVVSGREEMIGAQGEALGDFAGDASGGGAGRIRIHGEVWNAHSPQPVHRGQRITVTRLDGLVLHVEPQTADSQDVHR